MKTPTLIVGLGGTGSEIVQRIYEMCTPAQRKHIGFAVFDTDVNELRAIEERTPRIHTIQISTRLTVGEYLEQDHYSRDNWFPVNDILNDKALTEGAGQVRAVSRLALNTAIQQGKMTPLDDAITDLYQLNGEKMTQAPRIVLTGSLCGGTGSGLILPVAMYIRNFMNTKLQQGAAIIRGFFLLPEIYELVIKTQSEISNLRSNAYAAVREIDTFLMKDDGSLPKSYDLHFMAPRAGSRGQEEYKGKPVDFCFLYDAQNLEGKRLENFPAYKAHAAESIYAMAIAPTSIRSNSSEDNVIREIIYAGGRNRFAGAGSSRMVYPVEDMKQYLALNWARENVSTEWLEMDKRYLEEKKDQKSKRKQGYRVMPIDRGDHYIRVVNQGYTQKQGFSGAIRNQCVQFDEDGFGERALNWMDYIDALDNYVRDAISEESAKLEEIIGDLNKVAHSVSSKPTEAKGSSFSKWYKHLLSYQSATEKMTDLVSQNLIYSLFKDNRDYVQTDLPYRLEYWMRINSEKGTFMHPNAVRFFLYNTIKELKARKVFMSSDVKDISDSWASFEKDTFDDPNTPMHVETPAEFYKKSHLNDDSRLQRFLHKADIKDATGKLISSFGGLKESIDNYWEPYVLNEVYTEAINYMEAICDAFHSFYDVLDRKTEQMDEDIRHLEAKYVNKEGRTVRYVCANKTCMQAMASDITNLDSSLEIPTEMSRNLYRCMKEFVMCEHKPNRYKYFTEVFENTILQNMKDRIMDSYGPEVEMDIISALEKEAYYMDPEMNYALEDQRLYAVHVIEETRRLAKPFIESPKGKEARVIEACSYHSTLETADEPMREDFVRRYLKDNGGVSNEDMDEDIGRNEILFYQGVYDIRARELSKFAPPKDTRTYDQPGGEYFKAYHELISQLHPETERSKVITPHINRWWHVITMMPELDDLTQKTWESEIYKAFVWAMLNQYIKMRPKTHDQMIYHPELGFREDEELGELIVSNGTACDRLYEVLDAFTIYPKLVELVMNKVENEILQDINDNVPLYKTLLYNSLEEFDIPEFSYGRSGDRKITRRSIFEIPLLMKRTAPKQEFPELAAKKIIHTILDEIKRYMNRFCTEKDFVDYYGELLKVQYQMFIENTDAEADAYTDLYTDPLYIHILSTLSAEFRSMRMTDEVKKANMQMKRWSNN